MTTAANYVPESPGITNQIPPMALPQNIPPPQIDMRKYELPSFQTINYDQCNRAHSQAFWLEASAIRKTSQQKLFRFEDNLEDRETLALEEKKEDVVCKERNSHPSVLSARLFKRIMHITMIK